MFKYTEHSRILPVRKDADANNKAENYQKKL
jgi:hypothetical protein